jgi:hypothetical protein
MLQRPSGRSRTCQGRRALRADAAATGPSGALRQPLSRPSSADCLLSIIGGPPAVLRRWTACHPSSADRRRPTPVTTCRPGRRTSRQEVRAVAAATGPSVIGGPPAVRDDPAAAGRSGPLRQPLGCPSSADRPPSDAGGPPAVRDDAAATGLPGTLRQPSARPSTADHLPSDTGGPLAGRRRTSAPPVTAHRRPPARLAHYGAPAHHTPAHHRSPRTAGHWRAWRTTGHQRTTHQRTTGHRAPPATGAPGALRGASASHTGAPPATSAPLATAAPGAPSPATRAPSATGAGVTAHGVTRRAPRRLAVSHRARVSACRRAADIAPKATSAPTTRPARTSCG